jgi:thiol:disulfide interchange protein
MRTSRRVPRAVSRAVPRGACVFLVVALACGAGLLACAGEAPGSYGPTAFSKLPFADARAAAAAQDRLFLVDGTASWCPPCRTMEQDTWPDAEVRAWMDAHTVAVQVDVDEQPDLARELGISSMPTLILYRGDTELARLSRGLRPQELLDWLKGATK